MDAQKIILNENLTNAHAVDLHEECLCALKSKSGILIDVSDVKVVKTACIQVLMLLFKECEKSNIEVAITGSSEEFFSAIDLMNIEFNTA